MFTKELSQNSRQSQSRQLIDMSKFLNTLFDPAETTCFSENCFDTTLTQTPKPNDLFFSINPMHTSRKDANVTCFRNFLIEIDSMPLSKQIKYVQSKLPIDLITSIVFSGSKSYHFIISLETPLGSLEDYKSVALRLHKLFPEADSTSKNPSRFSRLPYRIRPDTGVQQELIRLGTRVPTDSFIASLPVLNVTPTTAKLTTSKAWISTNLSFALEHPDQYMLERGFAGRNHFFFYVYNRLVDEGFQAPEIKTQIEYMYARLENKTDFTLQEAYTAARIRG